MSQMIIIVTLVYAALVPFFFIIIPSKNPVQICIEEDTFFNEGRSYVYCVICDLQSEVLSVRLSYYDN